MTNYILRTTYFIACLLLVACSNQQSRDLLDLNNSEVEEYSETTIIEPTAKGPFPLPQELTYGRIQNRDCHGIKAEENLIRQYKAYFTALTLNDIESCKRYTFKDAVTYHKKMYPNMSEQEIWEQYFSQSKAVMDQFDKVLSNFDANIAVPVFYDKVSSQDDIFISFGSTMYLDANKYAIALKKLEKCIAYSNDGGKHWEFITLNSDSKGILALRCSQDVINILTKPSDPIIK